MTPGRFVTQQKMQLEMSLESWRVEGAGAWEGHTNQHFWRLITFSCRTLPSDGDIQWDIVIVIFIYAYIYNTYICRQICTYRHLFSCSTTNIYGLYFLSTFRCNIFIFNLPFLGWQVESFRVDRPQRWCPRGGRCKSHLLHPLGKAPRGHGLWQNVNESKVKTLWIFQLFQNKNVDVKKTTCLGNLVKFIVIKHISILFNTFHLNWLASWIPFSKDQRPWATWVASLPPLSRRSKFFDALAFPCFSLRNHLILPWVALGKGCIFHKKTVFVRLCDFW